MTPKAMLRLLAAKGGVVVRQKGSHVRVRVGNVETTVPVHAGEDLKPGTLRAIERQLEPALGKGWLKNAKK